jgi:predicted RecB family endonuclease
LDARPARESDEDLANALGVEEHLVPKAVVVSIGEKSALLLSLNRIRKKCPI